MKRYLILILAILVLASALLAACSQETEPISPITPRRTEQQMTYALYEYFLEEFHFNTYWARPRFPLDKWSASWDNTAGVWLVKAYDIDGSYVGTWGVPESTSREKIEFYLSEWWRDGVFSLSETLEVIERELKNPRWIQPYDEVAQAVESNRFSMGKMPAIPSYVEDPHDKRMIQAVQAYVANMSSRKADDAGIIQIWRAVRNHYPLEWDISYQNTGWRLVADYYEERAIVDIDPSTGQIRVFGWFAPPRF